MLRGNFPDRWRVEKIMKILMAAAGAALLACPGWGLADTTARCGQPIAIGLHARSILNIDSRPAGLEIVGTDAETMRITCSADNADAAREVSMRVEQTTGEAKLEIGGDYGPNNNLKIRIEVPHRTSVRVRMKAGQVDVDDVRGDMDVELGAGQITMRGVRGRDYRKIDASVDIGQVNAPAYGADKGGFFRSFTKEQPDGEYVLHAHILTGQIDLEGSGNTAE
jgi:hypothetical protein